MVQTASNVPDPLEKIVYAFVRDVVAQIPRALDGQPEDWDEWSFWERGDDGNYRLTRTRSRRLLRFLDDLLQSTPNYDECVSALKADQMFGAHLDRLVGTRGGLMRLEVGDVLRRAVYVQRRAAA